MIPTDAATLAQLDSNQHKIAIFIQVDYLSGNQYYCVAGHSLPWNGQTWDAIRLPLTISPVTEKETGEAVGHELTFTGIPTSAVSQFLQESIRGRPVRVWVAFLQEDFSIIGQPIPLISGKADSPSISISDQVSTMGLAIESKAAFWSRVSGSRYTDAEQQNRYSGDRFFSMVGNENSLAWPARSFYLR